MPSESSDDESHSDSEDSAGEQSDDQQDEAKEVASLGRRFLLTKGLWIKNESIGAELDEDYNEKKRFDGAQVQGQLRDILDILPDHYKGDVRKEKWFKRAVSNLKVEGTVLTCLLLVSGRHELPAIQHFESRPPRRGGTDLRLPLGRYANSQRSASFPPRNWLVRLRGWRGW